MNGLGFDFFDKTNIFDGCININYFVEGCAMYLIFLNNRWKNTIKMRDVSHPAYKQEPDLGQSSPLASVLRGER